MTSFLRLFPLNVSASTYCFFFLIEKCSYFSVTFIKQHIFKSKCNCRMKSRQEKESIMVRRCKLKISVTRVTVRHHSASLVMPNSYPRDRSLVMPNSYPRDGIFNQNLTTIKYPYIIASLEIIGHEFPPRISQSDSLLHGRAFPYPKCHREEKAHDPTGIQTQNLSHTGRAL